MAKDKSIMVTHRTHEILRREAVKQSSENITEGTIGLKDVMTLVTENIQETRKFADLPEKDA